MYRSEGIAVFAVVLVVLMYVFAIRPIANDMGPIARDMGKIRGFVSGFAPQQEQNNAGATSAPATPAQAQGYDPFDRGLQALSELFHRNTQGCSSTARRSTQLQGGPPPGTSSVLHWSTTEEANRIMETNTRLLQSGYVPREAQPIMMPPNPTSDPGVN